MKQILFALWSVFFIISPQMAFSQECQDLFELQENTLTEQVKAKVRNVLIAATVKHGEFIAKDDPNGYVGALFEELDNQEVMEEDPFNPLKGLNPSKEAKIQQTSVLNGNSQVTSYFKYFEKKDKETYEVAAAIWNRKRGTWPEEWEGAMEKAQSYLDYYNGLRVDTQKITARGFEALELHSILSDMVWNYRAKDFAQEPIKSQGMSYQKPSYSYNEETGKIEKTYQEAFVYRYDTLLADRLAAAKTYEQIFGLRTQPVRLVQNKIKERTPFDWARLKSPSYIVLSPFYILYGSYKLTKTSVQVGGRSLSWVWSLVKYPEGKFHRRLVAQSFERRRLEIVSQAILLRLQKFNINPGEKEEKLLKGIKESLVDPLLVPSSRALQEAQDEEYDAERSIVFGKKAVAGGDVAKPALNLYEDVVPVAPITVQGAFRKKAQMKIKKWAPTVIVTTVLLGTVTSQYNNIKEKLMDNPEVAVRMTALGNILYDFQKEYFGLDSLIYQDIKGSDRAWALENVAMPAAAKDGTQIFQDEYRLDSSKNFIADPEYQASIREIVEVGLIEREERGGSVAFQYTQDQTKNWGYPTRTVKLLMQSLGKQYPAEVEALTSLEEMLLADIDSGVGLSKNPEKYLDLVYVESQKLYKDLYYLVNKGMSKAVNHYAFYGSLLSPQGSIYETFIKSQLEMKVVLPTWNLRFTPHKSVQSRLFENQKPRLVWILSGANKDGFIKVEFLSTPEEESPTGEYFVSAEGVSSNIDLVLGDDTL